MCLFLIKFYSRRKNRVCVWCGGGFSLTLRRARSTGQHTTRRADSTTIPYYTARAVVHRQTQSTVFIYRYNNSCHCLFLSEYFGVVFDPSITRLKICLQRRETPTVLSSRATTRYISLPQLFNFNIPLQSLATLHSSAAGHFEMPLPRWAMVVPRLSCSSSRA